MYTIVFVKWIIILNNKSVYKIQLQHIKINGYDLCKHRISKVYIKLGGVYNLKMEFIMYRYAQNVVGKLIEIQITDSRALIDSDMHVEDTFIDYVPIALEA